ncbi:Endoplasmic reticulum, protein pkr1, partial [Globisporangium splendens]
MPVSSRGVKDSDETPRLQWWLLAWTRIVETLSPMLACAGSAGRDVQCTVRNRECRLKDVAHCTAALSFFLFWRVFHNAIFSPKKKPINQSLNCRSPIAPQNVVDAVVLHDVCAAAARRRAKRYSGVDVHYVEANYSADLQKKATRWRSERNWWISALTFTIYCVTQPIVTTTTSSQVAIIMMGRFVDNAMRPGSREFVIILNVVLAALFLVMLTVVYTELEDSYHMFVMLFIVVGLTVSINWFIIEANKLKDLPAGDATVSPAKDKRKQERAKTD